MRDLGDITTPLLDGLARGTYGKLDTLGEEDLGELIDCRCVRLIEDGMVYTARGRANIDAGIFVDSENLLQPESLFD